MARKVGKHNGKDVYGYDFTETEVKKLGENEIEITGSTEAQDRDNEVLKMDGWDLKEWKNNPVILPAHDYTAPAIGKGRVRKSEGKLKFKVEFPEEGIYPLADIYRNLYKQGFMKASSVGFMPEEWKNGEKPNEPFRTYTKQKLLELSLVSVPANPEALTNSKGLSGEDVKTAQEKGVVDEEKYKKFLEKVQEGIDKTGQDSDNDKDNETSDKDTDSNLEGSEEVGEKPYKNEHSCDLSSKNFDSFRRKNCDQKHDGKCIDVVYGIKEGKSEISSLRYKKDTWTKTAAKKHCDSREGKFVAATESSADETLRKEIEKQSKEIYKQLEADLDKKIEEKVKEAIKVSKDKEYYKKILFGSVGERSNADLEKEKTEKIVNQVKEAFQDGNRRSKKSSE